MSARFTTQIQARYRDINLGGHVDNVEAVRVLNEARFELLRFASLPGLPHTEPGLLGGAEPDVHELVASQKVEYHAEMRFVPYQPFLVTLWVTRIGRTSFSVGGEMRLDPDGAPAVAWECVSVMWDRRSQSPWPLNARVREGLQSYLGEPVPFRS